MSSARIPDYQNLYTHTYYPIIPYVSVIVCVCVFVCVCVCAQHCQFYTSFTNGWCQLSTRCAKRAKAGDPRARTFAKVVRPVEGGEQGVS